MLGIFGPRLWFQGYNMLEWFLMISAWLGTTDNALTNCHRVSVRCLSKRGAAGASDAACQGSWGPGHGDKIPVLQTKIHIVMWKNAPDVRLWMVISGICILIYIYIYIYQYIYTYIYIWWYIYIWLYMVVYLIATMISMMFRGQEFDGHCIRIRWSFFANARWPMASCRGRSRHQGIFADVAGRIAVTYCKIISLRKWPSYT